MNINPHISITSAIELEQICKPLISKTPIRVIEYSRTYQDGSRMEISNHQQRMIDSIYTCSIMTEHIYTPDLIPDSQRYLFFDSWIKTLTGENQKILVNRSLFQRKHYNLDGEFRIIIKSNKYTEMLHFYLDYGTQNMENFYFNNIDLLENFLLYLKSAAYRIIEKAEANLIIKPWRGKVYKSKSSIIDCNTTQFDKKQILEEIKPQNFHFNINGMNIGFTSREKDTIKYIIQGKTNKEIALIFGISHRTVEKFVEAILSKTNCYSRRNLVSILSKNKDPHFIFSY
jgi:LuxR family quorum-sensing system transcriptional regulator SolR